MVFAPPPPGLPRWAQLIAQGAAQTIYYLRQVGRAAADIYATVRRIFGPASTASIQAVERRVEQAALAGRLQTRGNRDLSVNIGLIPEVPLLPPMGGGGSTPGLRYFQLVEYGDPSGTGTRWATVIIDSRSELTRGELVNRTLEVWESIAAGQSGSDKIRGRVNPAPLDIITQMAWRTE